MPSQFPPDAVLAHGYLHAFEVELNITTGQPQLWINTDLLHKATVLNNRLQRLDAILQEAYYLDNEPAGFSLYQPQAGPLHETFRAIATRIAYDTVAYTPQDIASIYATGFASQTERSTHIGASPIRLHAFIQWIETEQLTGAKDLAGSLDLQQHWIKHEASAIAAAFKISAASNSEVATEIIGYEMLEAKRARIHFVM